MTARVQGDFDTLIHAPKRLQICAVLDTVGQAEFALLRERLDVSDSVLSKHLKSLQDAGYVQLRKHVLEGRTRTWASFTRQGRQAYRAHVAALRQIVG